MASQDAHISETMLFTQGVPSTITKTYANGDGYRIDVAYDGDSTITIDTHGAAGAYDADATYTATDAKIPYVAFGTRKVGVTPGLFSASFGEGLIAQYAWQTVIGKFNAAVNKLLVLGNGTSDTNRSNALIVDWDGSVECGGVTCTSVNGVDPSATVPVSRGGTGQTSANAAARELGLAKTAGDSWTMNNVMAVGFLNSTKLTVNLCIQTPFRFYDATGVTLTGTYKVRQYNGIYLMGSSESSAQSLSGRVKASSIDNSGFVLVNIGTGTAQGSTATANGACTVQFPSLTIKLT